MEMKCIHIYVAMMNDEPVQMFKMLELSAAAGTPLYKRKVSMAT